MYIHSRHFYEVTGEGRYRAEERLREGWLFRRTEDDDNWTTYSNTTGDYFSNAELDDLESRGVIKEVFKEPKPANKNDEFFKFALKIAKCGDIDGNLSGQDSSQIDHYEWEYSMFSDLWKLPREEEDKWLGSIESRYRIHDDNWFEDEEVVGTALLKFRMVKQYLAEIKA